MVRVLALSAFLLAGCATTQDCPRDNPACKPGVGESTTAHVLLELLNPFNWVR